MKTTANTALAPAGQDNGAMDYSTLINSGWAGQ